MTMDSPGTYALAPRPCANCSGTPPQFFCGCILQKLKGVGGGHCFRQFRSGETVAAAGFPLPFFGAIVDGAASVDISLPDGRVQGVSLLCPPDVIGTPLESRSKYTVTALSDLNVCCISPRILEKLLDVAPRLRLRLLEMKLADLDRARSWLTLLGRRSAPEKVAYFIVRVAQKTGFTPLAGSPGEIEITIPISRERIGVFLGLSTETVSREIARLEQDGILIAERSRTIVVQSCSSPESRAGIDDDGAILH